MEAGDTRCVRFIFSTMERAARNDLCSFWAGRAEKHSLRFQKHFYPRYSQHDSLSIPASKSLRDISVRAYKNSGCAFINVQDSYVTIWSPNSAEQPSVSSNSHPAAKARTSLATGFIFHSTIQFQSAASPQQSQPLWSARSINEQAEYRANQNKPLLWTIFTFLTHLDKPENFFDNRISTISTHHRTTPFGDSLIHCCSPTSPLRSYCSFRFKNSNLDYSWMYL